MKRRFQPREALLLYATAFGCALGFFLLGVYAGRSFFPAAPPVTALPVDPARGESAKADLNFYKDLVPPDADKTRPDEPGQPAGPATGAAVPEGSPSAATPSGDAPAGGAPAEKTTGAAPSPRRFVTVQVGALSTMGEARQMMIRLEAKGYLGRLVEPAEPGDFFRVWVGEFDSEAEARGLEERLKSDDFPTYVKTVKEPAGSN